MKAGRNTVRSEADRDWVRALYTEHKLYKPSGLYC